MKLSELIGALGAIATENSLAQDPSRDPDITGVDGIHTAPPGTLSFAENRRFSPQVATTRASALILPQDSQLQNQASDRHIAWIASPHPRLLFAQAIALMYQPYRPEPEIHPTAIIHPTAQIGARVYLGPYVVIQAGVRVGNDVCIHPHVVVYPDVEIGDRTVLHASCVIHERTRIGQDCVIHSGAVIGSEGFGFVPSAEGWVKMEQSGITILSDRVEVGCNSAVDRPAGGQTVVGFNTKLDNLVQIGHSATLGSNCLMAGLSALAGSAHLGNNVTMAAQALVVNQVTIGDGSVLTVKATAFSDVPPGETVSGTPTVPHRTFLKAAVVQPHLPELAQSVKALQRQVAELKAQLSTLQAQ